MGCEQFGFSPFQTTTHQVGTKHTRTHTQNVSKDQRVGETVQLFEGQVWINNNLQSFDGW